VDAGAPNVRVVNRSLNRVSDLVAEFDCEPFSLDAARTALADASAIINATPAAPVVPFEAAPATAIVMDMVYRPIVTPFIARARAQGLVTVDGLAMLIGQARPSFRAFFGVEPPPMDVRALAIAAMETQA
jgi:shikimate dehydrogenase